VDSTCAVRCDTGYKPNGPVSVYKCGQSGSWTPTLNTIICRCEKYMHYILAIQK